ncbi:MAG: tetratricopeptide repeat protein [Pseudomonadota bacterium]
MNTLLRSLIISLPICCSGAASAENATADQAAAYYQEQNWLEAIKAYKSITSEQPENYLAWFRLGNSLLQTQQGEQALPALEQASKSPAIPAFIIAYHTAQAHKLSGDEAQMWEQLGQAVASGYSSLATMEQAKIWDDIRAQDKFQSVMKDVEKNAKPCEFDHRFREFDFWLGKWAVYGNVEKTGPLYGNNLLEKAQNGCMVLESWTGASGSIGTSMNYFDGTKDKWVQHWVSAGGTTINIEGGLVDESMVMVGEIFYLNGNAPKVRDFRAKWTPMENGVVRQFFEESTDKGETWYTWFEGFYFPE